MNPWIKVISIIIGIALGIVIAWIIDVDPVKPRIKRITAEKPGRVTRGRRIW